MKTFLMTYTSFTTPTKLLRKLIQRYDIPPKESIDSGIMKEILPDDYGKQTGASSTVCFIPLHHFISFIFSIIRSILFFFSVKPISNGRSRRKRSGQRVADPRRCSRAIARLQRFEAVDFRLF